MLYMFLSFLKSVYFNFRHLPFKQAIKLPIIVHHSIEYSIKGTVCIQSEVSFAMIRFGFHKVPSMDSNVTTRLMVKKGGKIVFKGSAHIGKGSKICIEEKAYLELGDNFAISANSSILCYKKIIFGRNIQFSWDCLVMDSDAHQIYYNNVIINPDKNIVFGNSIWIACNSIILKGVELDDNCVIGAGSVLLSGKYPHNSIIAGYPAKPIKNIDSWKI